MLMNQPHFKYVFLLADVAILSVAFLLALSWAEKGVAFTTELLDTRFIKHLAYAGIFLLVYLFCFWNCNLYKRHILTTRYRQTILLLRAMIIGSTLTVLFMAFFKLNYFSLEGKYLILYFFGYAMALLILFRVIVGRALFLFLSRRSIYRSRILIVGGDEAGRHVAKCLQNAPSSEFQIAGFLDDYKEVGQPINGDFQNLGKLDDLDRVMEEGKISEILIAIDHAPYERLVTIVERCLQTGKVVRVYSNLLEVLAEKMNVEFYAGVPVIMLSQFPLSSSVWFLKRVFDVVMSALALLLLSPLFLVIAAGIKLSSRGPVFYKQVRIGKGGKPFSFYKFRSMHVGNDDSRHREFVKNLITNGTACAQKDIRVFKITNDPRIFKFGRFIRKTSFDEFPQFFNVLRGDMTLVGPRPCLPYEWECYSDWHKKRLTVSPGCTGLWQALGRSTVTFQEMVIMDLYYISNMTPLLDLKIILQTFPVIFLAKGAH